MLQGFADLERRMNNVTNTTQLKGLTRNAVRAGQRVCVKQIKALIPGKYKDARKAIGSSYKQAKIADQPGQSVCKIGAAVGIKRLSGASGSANAFDRRMRSRRGVGISAQNIHWFILGTKRMQPPLAGIVKQGFAASQAEAASKMKQNLANGLAKLAK